MKQFRNIRFFIIAAMLLSLLTGCSYTLSSFIRNFSDQPITVMVQTPSFRELTINSIPFDDQILKIRRKTARLLKDSLPIYKTSSSSYSFVVPPHSTAAIWPLPGVSTLFLRYVNATVTQGSFTDTLHVGPGSKFKSAWQTVYYDFKQ